MYSVLPWRVIAGLSNAMLEGALKYGRHNYRVAGVKGSVYFDAAIGHLLSWWEGEDIDQDSGLNHLDKAMASLLVLRDGIYEGNWMDDRPPSVDPAALARDNEDTSRIFNKYPNPKEPHVRKPESRDADDSDTIKGTPCEFQPTRGGVKSARLLPGSREWRIEYNDGTVVYQSAKYGNPIEDRKVPRNAEEAASFAREHKRETHDGTPA